MAGKAKEKAPAFRETDLYPPVKSWLEENGYVVRAEVGDCDVAAVKDGELVLVELKRAINLDLLLQAVRRQRARAGVYAAVPAPKTGGRPWRERMRLLRRLEIGLMVVYLDSALPRVEVLFHPIRQERRQSAAVTRTYLREIDGRSKDLNVGGRNGGGGKLRTAYWERALAVATGLDLLGPTSPRALREAGADEKTALILRGNHYGWFERLGTGRYGLTGEGRRALVEHADVAVALRQRLKKIIAE